MTDSFPHSTLPETDVWRQTVQWLSAGQPVAIATVVDTWGSAPVPLGGQMAIASEDSFQGSVSGGCVETDVITEALTTLQTGKTQLLSFGVEDETAWRAGLPCGGRIEILVERLAPPDDLGFAERMASSATRRQPLLIETNLASGHRKIHEFGDAIPDELNNLFQLGRSRRIKTEEADRFILAVKPPPRIIIIGATHIAQALVAHLGIIKTAPIIVDPRESFASRARFGETPIINQWPGDAFADLQLDQFTAVVALSHVANIDDEALTLALRSKTGYVGALGSRRNHAKRCERLLQAGFSDDDLARIKCPIGLDIGAVTPEEIALSIAAEVLLAFRQPKRATSEPLQPVIAEAKL